LDRERFRHTAKDASVRRHDHRQRRSRRKEHERTAARSAIGTQTYTGPTRSGRLLEVKAVGRRRAEAQRDGIGGRRRTAAAQPRPRRRDTPASTGGASKTANSTSKTNGGRWTESGVGGQLADFQPATAAVTVRHRRRGGRMMTWPGPNTGDNTTGAMVGERRGCHRPDQGGRRTWVLPATTRSPGRHT